MGILELTNIQCSKTNKKKKTEKINPSFPIRINTSINQSQTFLSSAIFKGKLVLGKMTLCFGVFWSHCTACGILVPWPGMELALLQWSHWTARDVPSCSFSFFFILGHDMNLYVTAPLLKKKKINSACLRLILNWRRNHIIVI